MHFTKAGLFWGILAFRDARPHYIVMLAYLFGMYVCSRILWEEYCAHLDRKKCNRKYQEESSQPDKSPADNFVSLGNNTLVKPGGHAWMLTDGDPAGDRHARSHFAKVSLHRFVRWVKLAERKQPTDLSAEQLQFCFAV